MTTTSDDRRLGLLLLALLCAFSFGAIVKVASAVSYHVTCVAHGFVEGGSQTDGSFFSRIDSGCGSPWRKCYIYANGVVRGSEIAYDSAICNAWSRDYGDYTECTGQARTYDPGVFSDHFHNAPNWCM